MMAYLPLFVACMACIQGGDRGGGVHSSFPLSFPFECVTCMLDCLQCYSYRLSCSNWFTVNILPLMISKNFNNF